MATLENQRVLCISCSDTWAGPWKSRHQILARLLPKNDIFFVEEPHLSILSVLRDRKRIRRFWSWGHVRRPQKGLWLYTPVLALPFGDQYKSIQYINNIILLVNLWIVLKAIGFRPTIVWTFSHVHGDILKRLGGKLTVYTAHDVWDVYPRCEKQRQREREYEEQTLRVVDVAFFTAKANMERKGHLCSHPFYLPHGCPTLPPGSSSMEAHDGKPRDLPAGGQLLLGYWGVISRALVDVALLGWLAAKRPDWTFVLIGPIYKPDMSLLERLSLQFRNVVLLGGKHHDEMHRYLRALDVGLLCHPKTDMKVRSSPLKVWDYISAGLPVVSIPIPEIEPLKEFVYFADTREQWEQMIQKAAADNTVIRRQRRWEFAEINSWDRRVAELSAVLAGHLGPCVKMGNP
jgi:hypothetical protein